MLVFTSLKLTLQVLGRINLTFRTLQVQENDYQTCANFQKFILVFIYKKTPPFSLSPSIFQDVNHIYILIFYRIPQPLEAENRQKYSLIGKELASGHIHVRN